MTRVLSLLPSATELLWAIGAGDLQVGRSHECDYPTEVLSLPLVTAPRHQTEMPLTSIEIDEQVRTTLAAGEPLYTIDEDRIRTLNPDVILTQNLCEVCSIDLAAVERLAASMDPSPQVIDLSPALFSDILDDALRVGKAVGRPQAARDAVTRWQARMYAARHHVNAFMTGPEVAFLEWVNPLFVGGHWTPDLIEMAGGTHSLNQKGAQSVVVTPDQLVESQPEYLIICPCGESLEWAKAEAIKELTNQPWWNELPAVRNNKTAIVDGHWMFNIPGPRLVDAFCFLIGWLHNVPEIIPDDFAWEQLPHS